jgi:hypothetical protein
VQKSTVGQAEVIKMNAQPSLSDLTHIITKYYGPDIAQAVTAGLAVIASHSLAAREHCLSLIYVGPSGVGKSVAVEVFMPDNPSSKTYLHRVDAFTPASFVSHAANIKEGQLRKIDLLPKIKDKTMLTKELSPLFGSGDQKEMQKNFSILTAVLDGKGYVTESGAHGERGYDGEYLFNWIGATTPFGDRVYKMMGQLGNRMYFFELPGSKHTDDELVEFAKNPGGNAALKECRTVVNAFIIDHFKQHPINSVQPNIVLIPDDDVLRKLVQYANLIAYGRKIVEPDYNNGDFTPGSAEGPHRIILSLKMIAQGSALVNQRSAVGSEDLKPIRYIAFSSIPSKRRDLLRALLLAGGSLTSAEVAKVLEVSSPTASSRMKELAATGIADFKPGEPQTSTPGEIVLADNWRWLLSEGTPLKRKPGRVRGGFLHTI